MSDHIEHRCPYCGSLLHYGTDDNPCAQELEDSDRAAAQRQSLAQVIVGRKDDGADGKGPVKLRWSLLPIRAVEEVIRALEFGAQKYGDWNWKHLLEQDPEARDRYWNAAMRHLAARQMGERLDLEEDGSGLHHLAHAIACCLFLLAHDLKFDRKVDPKPK